MLDFLQLLMLQGLLHRLFDWHLGVVFDHRLLRRHLDHAIDHFVHLDIPLQVNILQHFQLLLMNLLNLPVLQLNLTGLRHQNRHLMQRLVNLLQSLKHYLHYQVILRRHLKRRLRL